MTISKYLDIVINMKSGNFFKALADETRLRMVNLVRRRELNVNDIVAIMGMGQSRISRHLKILTDCGLLTFRRDGLWTFYTIQKSGDGADFLQAVSYLFDREPIFQADETEAQKWLAERSRETVRFFDSIAGDWEKLKREIIGDFDLNGLILGHIPVKGTAVDLGCGTGDLLAALIEKAERVIGVEKSPKMLEEARRRFAPGDRRLDLRIGELEHLPLREGEADTVVTNMVLHHLPDPVLAIREVFRVIKPGGPFLIVDLVRHSEEVMRERHSDRWLGFDPEEVSAWLNKAGFTRQQIDYFDLKRGLKGFILKSIKKELK